jgi:hypothetical protein
MHTFLTKTLSSSLSIIDSVSCPELSRRIYFGGVDGAAGEFMPI